MKNLLILISILLLACSSKEPVTPHTVTSVFKEFPPGKIKSVKNGETMISLTHKTLKQTDGNSKHELLDCLRTELTYIGVKGDKINLEARYFKCSRAKMESREKYIIIYRKPCVLRFETLMIQVMEVSENKITYRIIRDKG